MEETRTHALSAERAHDLLYENDEEGAESRVLKGSGYIGEGEAETRIQLGMVDGRLACVLCDIVWLGWHGEVVTRSLSLSLSLEK